MRCADIDFLDLGTRALGARPGKQAKPVAICGSGSVRGSGRPDQIQRPDPAAPFAHLGDSSNPQVGMVVAGFGGPVDYGGRLRVDNGQNVWNESIVCHDNSHHPQA